jgi:peptidoglycan hydrolase CwlO-like protein
METPTPSLTLKSFQKHIYIAIAVALGGGIVSGIGTGVTVYYKTINKIEEHTEVITKLTNNVDAITFMVNELKTKTAVEATAPVNQQKQIDEVKRGMEKLEMKIDKIYDLMLTRGK